jgi:hypothetical protein
MNARWNKRVAPCRKRQGASVSALLWTDYSSDEDPPKSRLKSERLSSRGMAFSLRQLITRAAVSWRGSGRIRAPSTSDGFCLVRRESAAIVMRAMRSMRRVMEGGRQRTSDASDSPACLKARN